LIAESCIMAWPLATDYSSAIQNPASCFADPELAAGQSAIDLLGLPLTYAGNFANVYRMQCLGEPGAVGPGRDWAVKCFTREASDRQHRYAFISQHLERHRRRFAVDFRYLAEGIRIKGQWYPILKMRWVEGYTLNEFLREHAGNAALLEQLCGLWLRLAAEMRESQMAHGDLQHGNVLLVPGSKASAMVLRLIDYDGMWVPDLAGEPPGETGHPSYQHPGRIRDGGYNAEIDRFAHLVIYTALRCLVDGGLDLWERHDNGENLLFREADFRQPWRSNLWPQLLALPDPAAATLAGHLLIASHRPIDQVPLLSDLVVEGQVAPLSAEHRYLIGELVPAARPLGPLTQPRSPVPPLPARPTQVVAAAVEVVPQVVPAETIESAPLQTIEETAETSRARELMLPAGLPPVPSSVASVPVVLSEARPADWPAPAPLPMHPLRLPPAPRPLPALTRPGSPGPAFPVPDWLLALGLPPHSRVVRYWPIPLGMLLGMPLVVLVIWLMWPSPKPQLAPPPILAWLQMPGAAVDLPGGKGRFAEVELQIVRSGSDQGLELRFTRLPAGVEAALVMVPAGSGLATVKARLTASDDLEDRRTDVTVSLWRGKEILDQKPLDLILRRFRRPRLGDVPAIRLMRGTSRTVIVPVQANGNSDRWALSADSLPPGVTIGPPRRSVPGGSVGVEFTVASDAKLVEDKMVGLELRAGDTWADHKTVPLSVEALSPNATVRLEVSDRISVRAGETTSVTVRLHRLNYDGPVRLTVLQLPEGVTVQPVDVPGGEDLAQLSFKVGRKTVPPLLNPVISIHASVGKKEVGKEELALLIIERAESTRR
jgi:hypothetical protein